MSARAAVFFLITWAIMATAALGRETASHEIFIAAIERAHHAEAWRSHAAFQANITVTFGGETALEGTMLFETQGRRVRMVLADGTLLVFDGEHAWVSPADAEVAGPPPRFHLLTWPYFVAAPFKLRDPGTHLEDMGLMTLRDQSMPAARLTFDSGVGDTPDDWYILYRDPQSHHLAAMAYIVTYGASAEEAEKEPHAITYEQVKPIDGVAVPQRWRFWLWDAEHGLVGDPIGEVWLNNVRFVTPDADAFARPDDARRDDLPLTQ